MNYREARQIEKGPNAGKWHYTLRNASVVRPDGACRADCPGHDTSEEAYEHERQRIVAGAEIQPLSEETRMYSPGVCEAAGGCTRPATHQVVLPHPQRIVSPRLCDEHATPESVDALVMVGPSMASW